MKYPDKINIILLLKLSIIEKAQNLGWNIVVIDNRIILKKKLNETSKLENNTKRFLEYLIESR